MDPLVLLLRRLESPASARTEDAGHILRLPPGGADIAEPYLLIQNNAVAVGVHGDVARVAKHYRVGGV